MNKYICNNCENEKIKDYWIPCSFCNTKCCNLCIEKLYCNCMECICSNQNNNTQRCGRCSYNVCKKCKITKMNDKKKKLKCRDCKKSGCQICISSVCCDCSYLKCYHCKYDNLKCGCKRND